MEEFEITEKNFKEEVLSKEKFVLLEFYGTWCMPCKMEAKILDKVEEEHKDVKVVRLDIDKNMITGEVSKTGLPTSNVLYYELENDAWCCVRPSGTEPKIKLYMGVKAGTMEKAELDLDELKDDMKALVK